MKLHTLLLPADGRMPATAPATDDAPHAEDTAACLDWLQHPAQLCDPYVPLHEARAVTLTVGRIVVMVAHEREGYAVALYQDGALNGRGNPGSLGSAWATYLHECARMAQVLAANIQTHVDATKAMQPAPEAP